MFSLLRLLMGFGMSSFFILFATIAIGQNMKSEMPQEGFGILDIITSVPRSISFQGILKDNAGSPITDTLSIAFRIYDIEIGGSALWLESVASVPIIDGNFNAILGETTPLSLGFDVDYWLSLQVEGDPEEMEPRLKLNMSPYSARSDTADFTLNSDLLDGLDSGDFAGTVHAHDEDYVNEGQADAISSGMILDGDIQFNDFGQNGANDGQIIKWDASFGWVAADENTGGNNGWIDDGNVVMLETDSDIVGIGTVEPTEKLDVQGNIKASGTVTSGNTVRLDGINSRITSASGYIDFDDEFLITTGRVTIGSGNVNSGTHAFVVGESNTASGSRSSVTGGQQNTASGGYSHVAGGTDNEANNVSSTVGGGASNISSGSMSTVGGGNYNEASSFGSTVAGGRGNESSGSKSTIGGGSDNIAIGDLSTIAGGANNIAGDSASTVCGGFNNRARGKYSVIAGGGSATVSDSNMAGGSWSSIGGGYRNFASESLTTIGGGRWNWARGKGATVGGGEENVSDKEGTTVCGGQYNRCQYEGEFASIGGGLGNLAIGYASEIGGGYYNGASDSFSTVAGGRGNGASGPYGAVAGGYHNHVYGDGSAIGGGRENDAAGYCATVPGGRYCSAAGQSSIAAGNIAKANHSGSIVISADNTGLSTDSVSSGGMEQMVLRADGGIYLTEMAEVAPYDNTNLITTRGGAYLSNHGQVWFNYVDRNSQENFRSLNDAEILEKIAELPITEWNYKVDESNEKHIAPVAQDFYRIFGLGDNDKCISTIDPSGIALAGIQALLDKIEELESRIIELEKRTK